jgi:glycosyltransferase-like protein
MGCPVHVFALGDPAAGFFRPTAVPHTVFPAPQPEGTLEDRVWHSLSALQEGLERTASREFDVLHAQDCIASRAVVALREAGVPVLTVRTVHHVDDFTTEALVECQRRSILDPDRVLVVSQYWRQRLQDDFGVHAEVVTNGVNLQRCQPPRGFDRAVPRARIGASGRMLFLTVGGIEPRKGTRELVEAMAMLRSRLVLAPLLAIVGGHSFQDYRSYATSVLQRARNLGLKEGKDIVFLGTVPDAELASWYHSADAFVFPSVAEGWGLALLEAMGSGLPVIATDMPVFREFLDRSDAVLVPPADAAALSRAMLGVATDPALRRRLALNGPKVAARYTWEACAQQHRAIYGRLVRERGSASSDS